MPQALASLAAWPVMSGLLFIFRSPGIAFNEVVVALLDETGAAKKLQRFATVLGIVSSLALFWMAATPLGEMWFATVSGLSPELVALSAPALWLSIFLPAMNTKQSWFQGALLNRRQTHAITEGVVVFLLISALALGGGVWLQSHPGLTVGLAGGGLSRVV
jgi:hypothetical protein